MPDEVGAVKKKPHFSNKQKMFIDEYLKCWNAAEAARRAGYSEKTARSMGCENLTKPDIAEAIRARIDESQMSADEALLEMAMIARGDLTDLMDITTSGFIIDLLDENGEVKSQAKNIKKIKQKVITILGKKSSDDDKEIVETEIEMYDRKDALKTILQHHGQLNQKIELTGKDGERLIPDERIDRALSTLADAIGKIVPGTSPE